jgi:outer membrane protein assembly factor BamB
MKSNFVHPGWALLLSILMASPLSAEDWPQWLGPRRDGVWRETGIVERFESRELTPRWRTPISGGYAGPAVARGKVFVMDRLREQGQERVLCLDAGTGKILWTRAYDCSYKGVDYDSGPRCTPTVDGDLVYTFGAMGKLLCLRVNDGQVVWEKDCIEEYKTRLPTWGMAAHPLIDGERLIACLGGENGAGVVAFDKRSGREIWRALEVKSIGYAPPVIYTVGSVRQLIVWHPEAVCSLDPTSGKLYWQEPFHTELGVSIVTPVYDPPHLFVSQSWGGPLMLELSVDSPAARVAWKLPAGGNVEEEMVNCLMSTPILRDGHIYGIALYGALRCLDRKDGGRVWETYEATGRGRWWNAFLTPQPQIGDPDRVFIANEQGELIIARLSPKGYEEISRAKLIEPTVRLNRRDLVWSHPAYANQCIYARNDKEILCVSLAASGDK